MTERPSILLFVGDRPVLSSLEFVLSIEGFTAFEGSTAAADVSAAGCLLIDQGYEGDGIAFLGALRQCGCAAPAVLLVTAPTPAARLLAAAAGAVLIEKPLLGEELTHALREALASCATPEPQPGTAA